MNDLATIAHPLRHNAGALKGLEQSLHDSPPFGSLLHYLLNPEAGCFCLGFPPCTLPVLGDWTGSRHEGNLMHVNFLQGIILPIG